MTGGSVHVETCLFQANSSRYLGGGLAVHWYAALECVGSVFVENECTSLAPGGSALSATTHTSLIVERCTMDRNPTSSGGVIVLRWGNVTAAIRNVIVSNTSQGIPIFSPEPRPDFAVECCDFWNNTDGDWSGLVLDGLDGVDGNFSADPLYCEGAGDILDLSGPYALAGASPCAPGNHPDGVDCGEIGGMRVGCAPVSVVAAAVVAPSSPLSPNPFRTSVQFREAIQSGRLYDAHGREVRVLSPGAVVWDGVDNLGQPVMPGVYFFDITLADGSRTRCRAIKSR